MHDGSTPCVSTDTRLCIKHEERSENPCLIIFYRTQRSPDAEVLFERAKTLKYDSIAWVEIEMFDMEVHNELLDFISKTGPGRVFVLFGSKDEFHEVRNSLKELFFEKVEQVSYHTINGGRIHNIESGSLPEILTAISA